MLAIESSCDDTCVALLERPSEKEVYLVEHLKCTLNSVKEGGIIPTRAFDHHQASIATLTQQIIKSHGLHSNPPDLICVTRGPGMKGSLSIGLDFAKGLSVAWAKPMVGVHHMLGHLLTPRFETFNTSSGPKFPFLTLLISGGHTMLVLSKSILEHEILCDTIDVACGDALDKCARSLGLKGNNLGKELETYVQSTQDHWFNHTFNDIPKPLYNKRGRVDQVAFAFGSFQGYVNKQVASPQFQDSHRPSLAYQIQKGIFDHILNKIELTLSKNQDKLQGCKDFVGSGGVASNMALRQSLDNYFHSKNFNTHYPSLGLCTDNAVMIGWAGIELYESGLTTELEVCPISKWPLSEIESVSGWIKNK